MAHGGYARRRVDDRKQLGRRPKGLGVDKKKKSVSLKNQIRSTERYLRKNLLPEVRAYQEQKLAELKKQQETQARLAIERKIHLRDKKIKFFERRKVERMIRRLEKQQRVSAENTSEDKVSDQLAKLREDLEYIRFFPKTEKYVSLFVGGDNPKLIDRRNKLRQQIKNNLIVAASSGKELEETASDDDVPDMSEDDFFSMGSSSGEAEADDEWTEKSTREPASSTSGKATSSMSSDERNQRQISERVLMPPPRSLPSSRFRSGQNARPSTSNVAPHSRSRPSMSTVAPHSRSRPSMSTVAPYSRSRPSTSNAAPHSKSRFSTSKVAPHSRSRPSTSNIAPHSRSRPLTSNVAPHSRSWPATSNVAPHSRSRSTFIGQRSLNAQSDHNSNLSSNSDVHKPRRKRRPKKKKEASSA